MYQIPSIFFNPIVFRFFVLFFVALTTLPNKQVIAQNNIKIKREAVVELFDQMSAAINSRKPDNIARFLRYYTASNASFTITSRFIDIFDNNQMKENVIKINQDDYIALISKIVRSSSIYGIEITLNSFAVTDNNFAVAITSSKEIMSGFTNYNQNFSMLKSSITNTNCSFTINIASPYPVILGARCIADISYNK